MEIEREDSQLVRLCIEAACQNKESVEKWRKQRRTLERMPSALADALLRRLLHRRLLFPSLLEVFKHCVEVVDLRGENIVDAEWMAYLGAFRYLHSLNLADCRRITSSALWNLTGMTSLKEIDVSGCVKVTDVGIKHLLSISTLEILCISKTGVTAEGVTLLSSLTNLSVLDLGGLSVTDMALSSLKVLTKLKYLDLWGSNVSNEGINVLQAFPKLSFLNLTWTSVTRLPNLPSLEYLNLSNCTINSIFEGNGDKAPLAKLVISGATFTKEAEAFLYLETSFLSFLDISNSSFHGFSFLSNMKVLEHLDLSSSAIGDKSIEEVASIGSNLRNLNLSKTKITTAGIAVLAGHVPKLESLSLSYAPIDDFALSYISMMPSLKVVDLSNTSIKGFIRQKDAEPSSIPSLTALTSLVGLENLNMEHTKITDAVLDCLLSFQELSNLSLRSGSLTDVCLYHLSCLSKLTNLSICDAVLTNRGLDSFQPPASLKVLDLRGCWLLTTDAMVSFSKRHPLVDIRHESLGVSPSNQNEFNGPFLSQKSSRSPPVNLKQGKMPMSWPMPMHFVDQRLKYSREELLGLQFSSLSLGFPHDGDSVRPMMRFD